MGFNSAFKGLNALFNFVASRSKQNPHTWSHANKCTHKQKRYKNGIHRPKKKLFSYKYTTLLFPKIVVHELLVNVIARLLFLCSIPYNYLKSITCYVILIIQNVVLRANSTLNCAFNPYRTNVENRVSS